MGRDPRALQIEKIFKLTEVATPVQKCDNNKIAYGTIAATTFHNLIVIYRNHHICLFLMSSDLVDIISNALIQMPDTTYLDFVIFIQ